MRTMRNTTKIWVLNSLQKPQEYGVYKVRLEKKHDLISPYHETSMWYTENGWAMDNVIYRDYEVKAWQQK